MRTISLIALILVIVGGLNWLLVGLFQFDLVAELFGGQTAALSRIVYVLVGLSAIWLLIRIPHLLERSNTHSSDLPRSTSDHGTGRP